MKTNLEIPDSILRHTESAAVQRGITLSDFIIEAIEEKLASAPQEQQKPWIRLAGGLKHLHQETVRINQILDSEFEQIESETPSRNKPRARS